VTTNPFKRLRELTGASQKGFAESWELSKTAMTYIESGQLVDLSDNMIVALGQECYEQGINAKQVLKDEYNAESLQDAYHSWQSNERMGNAHLFQVPITGTAELPTSPFATLIQDVAGTQQKFCKLLKVPAASVMRYASGDTQTMPRAVEDALTQVRFPYLSELKQVQEQWLDNGRHQ